MFLLGLIRLKEWRRLSIKMEKYYAGFDIGGCNVRFVIADENGKFLSEPLREKHDLSHGPLGVSEKMKEMTKEFASGVGVSLEDVVSVGISSAGPLDLEKFGGSIDNSTNIKFPDADKLDLNNLPEGYKYFGGGLIQIVDGERHLHIPLVDPLRDFFRREVYLGNDVNTAVIGVVMFGEGKNYGNPKDMIYSAVITTHGAGFGAGVWCRGGVFEGVHGNAAECGHLKVVDEGRECGCGNFGCAETFGSGTGIANNAIAKIRKAGLDGGYGCASLVYEKAMDELKKDNPADIDNLKGLVDNFSQWASESMRECLFPKLLKCIDAKLVFDVYRETKGQDRVAKEVVEEAGKYIGRAYGAINTFYNPHFIATYGSVTKNWDVLEKFVLEEMKKSTIKGKRYPDVFVTKLGDDVGLYGAIGRAMGYGR